jgi:MFS transporter, DHA1 family, tetracycline resistance protein
MTEEVADESRPIELMEFFVSFGKAKGAISTVVVTLSLSFALGCTVAIVPEILSDRFARLHHGYDWTPPCSSFRDETMPVACLNGSDDAQDASAWSSMFQNLLTLFFNPVVGKLSDVHGRRVMFILSIFTYTLGPLVLVAMQLFPTMEPIYYYIASSVVGAISYFSISFAILSDSVLEKHRTASFGVIMAGFYFGFSLSPVLALLFSHIHVSVLSAVLTVSALLYTMISFPETLLDSVRDTNQEILAEQQDHRVESLADRVGAGLIRPLEEMSILNRNKTIRLVAAGSFFSCMVHSADTKLVIFYIEEYLDVREKDVAFQFLVMGVVGVVLQGCLLQSLIRCFGDRGLLILSFLSGTVHNFLYGIATNKLTLYVALCLSQLTKTNTPILASLASKHASFHEQGQLQGALYAVNALGGAVGPLCMQFIYEQTKTTIGPGTMFVFASFLYLIGTIIVLFIPKVKIGDSLALLPTDDLSLRTDCEIEEPLLQSNDGREQASD